MDFYTAIADYYDEIFPLNKQAFLFVSELAAKIPDTVSILDIGCATGELSLALARQGCRVEGVDFDKTMITLANQKVQNEAPGTGVSFRPMDMRIVDGHFESRSFDLVCCLGNTLVHLKNADEIIQTLKAVSGILKRGGTFVLQILNYDYIVDNHINSLPLIKNETLIFERSYGFHKTSIDFDTKLTIKKTGQVFSNSVPLFPLRKDDLVRYLEEAGFEDIRIFGNFNKDPLGPESLPLVITAHTKQAV